MYTWVIHLHIDVSPYRYALSYSSGFVGHCSPSCYLNSSCYQTAFWFAWYTWYAWFVLTLFINHITLRLSICRRGMWRQLRPPAPLPLPYKAPLLYHHDPQTMYGYWLVTMVLYSHLLRILLNLLLWFWQWISWPLVTNNWFVTSH